MQKEKYVLNTFYASALLIVILPAGTGTVYIIRQFWLDPLQSRP